MAVATILEAEDLSHEAWYEENYGRRFDLLIKTEIRKWNSFARKYTFNSEDAKDITMEAIAKVRSALFRGKVREPCDKVVSCYLCRAIVRCGLDLNRGSERRVLREESGDERKSVARDHIEELLFAINLSAALNSIPEKYREAFILRAVEGRSIKESAKIMNVEEGTIKSRFFYSRKFLMKHLVSVDSTIF